MRLEHHENLGSRADFVVGARGWRANPSVGQELADAAFADDDGFERFPGGHLAVEKGRSLASPGHRAGRLDAAERNFFGKLGKALVVQFNAVQVEADEEFVGLLFRGGTLQYTRSTAQSTNRAIRISITGGATIDASGSTPGATLSFTAASSPDFFENPGDRTLTLAGTNTYTGATSVNVGTLNVTGSLASGSALALAGSATLKGTGTVGGTVTVASGGIITGRKAVEKQMGGELICTVW